ncbi:hypothetical protein [Asanoa siamensis]|uniref:DUF1707 domain-containing protein n=1 Tax=Asanoa siamensis TaxID=926357 RepID=A0ABQ4CSZ3_9ACTN|nr:hypothetical protein [Asanoa siamensis]GIF74411.1 hypothetical protein Asi02nite_39290 [Asanoa siamensis]
MAYRHTHDPDDHFEPTDLADNVDYVDLRARAKVRSRLIDTAIRDGELRNTPPPLPSYRLSGRLYDIGIIAKRWRTPLIVTVLCGTLAAVGPARRAIGCGSEVLATKTSACVGEIITELGRGPEPSRGLGTKPDATTSGNPRALAGSRWVAAPKLFSTGVASEEPANNVEQPKNTAFQAVGPSAGMPLTAHANDIAVTVARRFATLQPGIFGRNLVAASTPVHLKSFQTILLPGAKRPTPPNPTDAPAKKAAGGDRPPQMLDDEPKPSVRMPNLRPVHNQTEEPTFPGGTAEDIYWLIGGPPLFEQVGTDIAPTETLPASTILS